MRLAIALPHTGQMMYWKFFLSYTLLQKPDHTLLVPSFQFHGEDEKKNISQVRENLVEQAFDHACTHVLMMDTDQVYYTEDMIPRMLSRNKPFLGTIVHRRYPPFDPIVLQGTLGKYTQVPDETIYNSEVIEADALGFGCVLFELKPLLDLPQPWFCEDYTDDGKVVGEDINFCHCWKQAGYPIFVDTSIRISHLALSEVERPMYEIYKFCERRLREVRGES